MKVERIVTPAGCAPLQDAESGAAVATPESLPEGGVWWVSVPPVPDALRPARTDAPLRSFPGGLLGEVHTL